VNPSSIRRTLRVAAVSFLNAKPLLHGLQSDDVDLTLDVPSKLIDHLAGGSADVALLPVIDYQRLDDLRIVPAGGIGCDGPTLTVRLFSKRPIESIEQLACDTDSHTSVARTAFGRHWFRWGHRAVDRAIRCC
jgi:chorismate dehydratase